MRRKSHSLIPILVILTIGICWINSGYCQDDDDSTRNVLKNGLLGAGTGAIAAGASGGNAGKGALIGAGTNVIGGALLDMLTTPSRSSRRSAPPPQEEYYDDQGNAYYEEPPQESGNSKVIKQGLLGAGTGAIAAGTSGGNAGTGALIGAGTNVIGGALLDTITKPSQPRRVYRRAPQQQPVAVAPQRVVTAPSQNVQVQEEPATAEGGRKKIIKKYDDTGKLVSEEEIYY